jgi:hypothetical protein
MLSPIFDHRWRSEGMVESICTVCAETVCREPTLSLMKEFEAAHVWRPPVTIEITQPETEALIEQRMATGAFRDVEDALLQALKAAPPPEPARPVVQKERSLVEVCAMVRGLADGLDFSRNPSTSRPHLPYLT